MERMGGWRYVGRKVLQAFFTLIFVWSSASSCSASCRATPSACSRQRGIELSVQAQEQLRATGLGQGAPGAVRGLRGRLTRGQLGLSFIYQGESVMDVFLRFLWPTVLLVGTRRS
jgi:ABC-type dipeptide/oligopeptide/nickel transport system permease component